MGETWENSDLDLYIYRKEFKKEVHSNLCDDVKEVLRLEQKVPKAADTRGKMEVHRNVSYEPVSMFCIIRHENDHDCYIYVG